MTSFITGATYQVIWPDTANTTYTINGANGLAHISLDGTGIPPVMRKYSPYKTNDGGMDDGYQLDIRRMVWKVFISGNTEQEFDTARKALFDVFRPLRHPYRLKVTRADGAVRQIDCFVDGPIEVEPARGYAATATIPLVAPDPLWYDPTPIIHTNTDWAGSFYILNYTGSWFTWPVIKITGELTNLLLTNSIATFSGTRFSRIDLQPAGVPAGEYYVIDTRPGVKTIVNSGGANVLNSIPNFHYFPEFRLWPEPMKPAGENVIGYNKGVAGVGAAVEMTYYNRFIGL